MMPVDTEYLREASRAYMTTAARVAMRAAADEIDALRAALSALGAPAVSVLPPEQQEEQA